MSADRHPSLLRGRRRPSGRHPAGSLFLGGTPHVVSPAVDRVAGAAALALVPAVLALGVLLAGGQLTFRSPTGYLLLGSVAVAGVAAPLVVTGPRGGVVPDRGCSRCSVLGRLVRQVARKESPYDPLAGVAEAIATELGFSHVAVELRRRDGSWWLASSYGGSAGVTLRLELRYQDEVVGALLAGRPSPDDSVSDEERRTLAELAGGLAVIVNCVRATRALRRSHWMLMAARNEERHRMRRDLHDGLGPALAALTMRIDVARTLLRHDPRRAESLLSQLRRDAEDAVTDVRRMVYELRPPALRTVGLSCALRAQAARFERASGGRLTVVTEVSESLGDLSPDLELAVYHIASEALTNVARHAHARRCTLRLSAAAEGLTLEVADDGVGLPPGALGGLGLTSMRDRARELGGECVVTRGDGSGTRVLAQLPLERP